MNKYNKRNNNRRNNNRRNKKRNNKKFCLFCKNLGKDSSLHGIKDCPELLNMQCPHCGKKGHTIKYCPFIEKCKFCEKIGHSEDKCYFNPKNKIPKCNHCKKYGHIITECYYAPSELKEKILKERQDKKEKKEREEDEREERSREFQMKGYKYSEETLKFYKVLIDQGQIPWEVYDGDDEDCDMSSDKLSESEQKTFIQIKYEIKKLFG